MAIVLMAIIVNCRLHTLAGVWLQETGQNSHLRFYCLCCNLLTDHVIAIHKEKDSTAYHKEENKAMWTRQI